MFDIDQKKYMLFTHECATCNKVARGFVTKVSYEKFLDEIQKDGLSMYSVMQDYIHYNQKCPGSKIKIKN